MKESNLEVKVGLFVLAGLAAMGMLIMAFGKFGNYLKKDLSVGGGISGCPRYPEKLQGLMARSQIGVVADTPLYQAGQNFVELTLKINAGIEIPTGSRFRIDQYGMLGDRFVRVVPPEKLDGTFLAPGAGCRASRRPG